MQKDLLIPCEPSIEHLVLLKTSLSITSPLDAYPLNLLNIHHGKSLFRVDLSPFGLCKVAEGSRSQDDHTAHAIIACLNFIEITRPLKETWAQNERKSTTLCYDSLSPLQPRNYL